MFDDFLCSKGDSLKSINLFYDVRNNSSYFCYLKKKKTSKF